MTLIMNARGDLDSLPVPQENQLVIRHGIRPMATTKTLPRNAAQSRSAGAASATPRVSIAVDDTRKVRTLNVKAAVDNLNFYYGQHRALKNLTIPIADSQVTALIGPSGCGKSTFLRCFNRMHDLQPDTRYEGSITLHPDNLNLVGAGVDPIEVRMRIGMVFQKPNPFPKSIFENVAYGLRLRGVRNRATLAEEVEKALRGSALWDEVKDRLQDSALALSGGQMQRLCIARALATTPEILLFDEPTSALDPIATAKIEELISTLRDQVTVLIVTHNMQQAARVSDYTAFMYLGELIEFDEAAKIFTNPEQEGDGRLHHRPLRLSRRSGERCSHAVRSGGRPHGEGVRCRADRSCACTSSAWAAWSSTRSPPPCARCSTATRTLAQTVLVARVAGQRAGAHGRSRSVRADRPASARGRRSAHGDGRFAHDGRAGARRRRIEEDRALRGAHGERRAARAGACGRALSAAHGGADDRHAARRGARAR